MIGARPRTLPAAVVPVAVGSSVAVGTGAALSLWRCFAALLVSLAIQIGTNYANDYSDGIRGTDSAVRVGPPRLVGSGLAAPAQVKRAAMVAFGFAALVGLALAAAAGWQLILVGAACFLAAWFYTGGPKPYGYLGLGEVFVFVFFGLVATAGTTYVLIERLSGLALAASLPVGLAAVALLVVNNLRDIGTDATSGKRTLAVRIGDPATRTLYMGLVFSVIITAALVAVGSGRWTALLVLGALPLVRGPVQNVRSGASGRDLIAVLGATGRLQLAAGGLFALGLWLGGVLFS